MCAPYEGLGVGDAVHRDDLERVHIDVKGMVEHVLGNLRQCGAAADRSLLVACANALPPQTGEKQRRCWRHYVSSRSFQPRFAGGAEDPFQHGGVLIGKSLTERGERGLGTQLQECRTFCPSFLFIA